jgi:RNA:NAD 2'-phosphotransferase (TPT1/KptA family)
MADRPARVSTFPGHVLRHTPEVLERELAPGGWADMATFLEGARADGCSTDAAWLTA